MGKLFNVSSSPHVRSSHTTQAIMFDVAIAMLPASIYGVWQFGMHALLVLIATVVSCVLSEYIFEKLMKKPITVYDGSAVVTGMILALNTDGHVKGRRAGGCDRYVYRTDSRNHR